MKSKIVSGLLVLALSAGTLLTGFAGTSRAKEPPDISDTYELDGLTYYNAKSTNFNSDKRFFVDLISAKHSSLGGRSMADLWLMVAAGLGKDEVSTGLILQSDYLDKLKQALLTGKLPDDAYYDYVYSYSAPAWSNYDGGYVEASATIRPYTSPLSGVKYTVRFSDFSVGAYLPADQGLYVQTFTENSPVKSIAASSVKNDTADTATPTQDVTKSIAETLTSTVNHSSSYSFTEGLKMGAEASSFGIYKMSVEMSAQFQQAFTDGWSKSEGKTSSTSPKSGVSVTLPPYTCVLIKQGESDTTVTTKYNCPVILSYKVTITVDQSMSLGIRQFTFGSTNSDARKDLNHRAFEDGAKQYDPESIDWEKVLADSDVKDAIQKITTHVPMSGAGATMVYTNKTTYTEVAGKAPLYPLTSVQLVKSNIAFIDSNNVANMKIGNYSYVDYLTLNGLNSYNAPYYGFDPTAGRWVVVDENGNEFSSGNAPVVLEKEVVSGHTKFRAVKAGTCYLKYLINENKYPTSYGASSYTKNTDLTSTAALRIVVAEEEVTYEVTGKYSGIVNSAAESLEGDGKLEVSVYDSTGKEIEGSYLWDQKEIKGINLTADGMVSFTKGGTFHVRVTNDTDTIYSDWVEISAEYLGNDYVEPDDEDEPRGSLPLAGDDTTLIIKGSYVGGLSCDENIEGDGKLQVLAFDSNSVLRLLGSRAEMMTV